jgi:hypothetical protein
MVAGYYREMGWDPETGIPTEETLQQLRIDFAAADLTSTINETIAELPEA